MVFFLWPGRIRTGVRLYARYCVQFKEGHLRRTLVVLVTSTAFATAGVPAAMAGQGNPSPTGTGPPNQSCQSFEVPGTGANAPGNSGTSPGSVFNEPGFGSTSGGTGGNAYNNAGAPSQYDVACYHVNTPPH